MLDDLETINLADTGVHPAECSFVDDDSPGKTNSKTKYIGKNKKVRNKNGKVKKIKTEISTESENQNVENENGKVKKKRPKSEPKS